MRILGADLLPDREPSSGGPRALVALDDAGRVESVRQPANLADAAAQIRDLSGGEPFLAAVNVPLVVPARAGRARPFEAVVQRRLGLRIAQPRAGVADERTGPAGDALLGALAAAGAPSLPYPDRDRQRSGLAEMHEGLVLKALLWEVSPLASRAQADARDVLFRAMSPPAAIARRAAGSWADRAVALDLTLRALGDPEGYDLRPVRDALAQSASEPEIAGAAAVLTATLLAGTARRYLEHPESCLFLGDRETGYTVLPADGLIRRLALREGRRTGRVQLFPPDSLRERLGGVAALSSPDLLAVPGRPARLEAVFTSHPVYEFDNVDEMLWWKHTRHLDGPPLPVEGLQEMTVEVGEDGRSGPLRLVRSRHRTLSFRFEPPPSWRARVPPRDGRIYPMRVLRAIYETTAGEL